MPTSENSSRNENILPIEEDQLDHPNDPSLPSDIKLLPGERLIGVEDVPIRNVSRPPSALREFYRLAGVDSYGAIGDLGPVVASLAIDEEKAAKKMADHESFHKYEALFGRDSLRVALDVLPRYPKLMKATLLALARLQGTENNLYREEEPGRIIHESRNPHDPIAIELTEKNHWGWPYYGSVDATPNFIVALWKYCHATSTTAGEGYDFLQTIYIAKDGVEKTIADCLEACVDWTIGRLNANPEGLLEFRHSFEGSTLNQAWKDSPDAYHHADGTMANHNDGIASIEVQRLTYDALLYAANIYEQHLDKAAEAEELRTRAAHLRDRILDLFWTEDKGGYFVLGTDRDGSGNLRQLNIRTSNMGHILRSDFLLTKGERAEKIREAVIRQLFSQEMLNVSGIRTLASDEYRFRPGAYHNGSVWLWDTYFIARALAKQGYLRLAANLANRVENVISSTGKFVEYARGDDGPTPTINTRIVDIMDATTNQPNRLEQPPQEIQAWTVAASLSIKLTRAGRVRYRTTDDPKKIKLENEILATLET